MIYTHNNKALNPLSQKFKSAQMEDTTGKKIDMKFKQEIAGLALIVHGTVDGKEVGVCRTEIGNPKVLISDVNIPKGIENFSKPLIEYVIGLFSNREAVHCVCLSGESIKKLKPIYEEKGYYEIEPGLLVAYYPIITLTTANPWIPLLCPKDVNPSPEV